VFGADDDMSISRSEVESTARAYGTHAVLFPGMGHDMMLVAGWQRVADRIIDWLGRQLEK
jgi:hypothetical protein